MMGTNPIAGAWSFKATTQQLLELGGLLHVLGQGQPFTAKALKNRPGHHLIEGDTFVETALKRMGLEHSKIS